LSSPLFTFSGLVWPRKTEAVHPTWLHSHHPLSEPILPYPGPQSALPFRPPLLFRNQPSSAFPPLHNHPNTVSCFIKICDSPESPSSSSPQLTIQQSGFCLLGCSSFFPFTYSSPTEKIICAGFVRVPSPSCISLLQSLLYLAPAFIYLNDDLNFPHFTLLKTSKSLLGLNI
jgi:hypothetical protein